MAALPYNTSGIKRNTYGIAQPELDAALTASPKAFNAAAAPPPLYDPARQGVGNVASTAVPDMYYANALTGSAQPVDQKFVQSTGPVQAPSGPQYFLDPDAGWTSVGSAPRPGFDPNGPQDLPGGDLPGSTPASGGPTPQQQPATAGVPVVSPRPEDAITPGAGSRPVAQGIAATQQAEKNRIQALQNGIESGAVAPRGVGSTNINQVDAALTGYDPGFQIQPGGQMAQAPGTVSLGAMPGRETMGALPGTGSMGPLPGTSSIGALPGTERLGALPGATDRNTQMAALDRVLGYNPETASRAEALLGDATQRNMGQALALARSARGGPAAQAQALRVAQGENAATNSQSARDLSVLRAQEEDTAKQRELSALGLGGELSTSIRGADVSERGQNVQAQLGELQALAQQRGQTVEAVIADLQAQAQQRGQTLETMLGERQAGVQERGQTIGAQETALNAATNQRGQDVGALEAELAAGTTQRGQTIEQQVAERNAGVSERGQTLDTQSAMSQRELESILGRGSLAQTERQAGATERGQTLDAQMQGEVVKASRDAVSASALTDAEKVATQELLGKAELGYQLTMDERVQLMRAAEEIGDPGLAQIALGAIQAGATGAIAGGAIGGPIGAGVGGAIGLATGLLPALFD